MTVRQVVETAWPGDAVTSMALAVDAMLEGHEHHELYAYGIHEELAGRALPTSGMPEPAPGDVLVYHLSIGNPELVRQVLGRPEPVVLVYHNVTPPHLLLHQPELAARCAFGRLEPGLLRARVAASVADSAYNAEELRPLGYEPVVCPLGVDPTRLLDVEPTGFVERERARLGGRYALVVAQALPHKRIEQALLALRVLQQELGDDVGLAVVGYERDAQYAAGLRAAAQSLGLEHVWFTGRVADGDLAELYRSASVLLSASEHEGLGLPLWEAMAFQVPVVAIGHAAVPDTVGGAGLVLSPASGARQLAEAVHAVLHDEALAEEMRGAGARRLETVDKAHQQAALLTIVRRAAEAPWTGTVAPGGASPPGVGTAQPVDLIERAVQRINGTVGGRGSAVAAPAPERDLVSHLRHARAGAAGTAEVDAAVAALDAWPGFSAARISTATRTPGGRVVHALVGRLVRRQTEAVLAQAQEHAQLMQALVTAHITEQRRAAAVAGTTAPVLALGIEALAHTVLELSAPPPRSPGLPPRGPDALPHPDRGS